MTVKQRRPVEMEKMQRERERQRQSHGLIDLMAVEASTMAVSTQNNIYI